MNANEEELMALYAVIKRETEAIEELRRQADASIRRLEGIKDTIQTEVTQEAVQGISKLLYVVKNDFKKAIEQQGIESVQNLDTATARLSKVMQEAEGGISNLKVTTIVALLSMGIAGGMFLSASWFHGRFENVSDALSSLSQSVESCNKPIKVSDKKRHKN